MFYLESWIVWCRVWVWCGNFNIKRNYCFIYKYESKLLQSLILIASRLFIKCHSVFSSSYFWEEVMKWRRLYSYKNENWSSVRMHGYFINLLSLGEWKYAVLKKKVIQMNKYRLAIVKIVFHQYNFYSHISLFFFFQKPLFKFVSQRWIADWSPVHICLFIYFNVVINLFLFISIFILQKICTGTCKNLKPEHQADNALHA